MGPYGLEPTYSGKLVFQPTTAVFDDARAIYFTPSNNPSGYKQTTEFFLDYSLVKTLVFFLRFSRLHLALTLPNKRLDQHLRLKCSPNENTKGIHEKYI